MSDVASHHHAGACLCGAVRFEIEGGFERFYLCHCVYCRKDTGSAHAANLFSATATLHWRAGQDMATLYRLPGTRHARCFCAVCGSALPYTTGRLLVVPAGALDDAFDGTPDAHLFVASRAAWDRGLEHVPAFDGFPS